MDIRQELTYMKYSKVLWDRKDRFKVFATNGINSFKSDREDRTKQINVFS